MDLHASLDPKIPPEGIISIHRGTGMCAPISRCFEMISLDSDSVAHSLSRSI